MAKIDEVLNRHWQDLKALHPVILNVAVAEKWANGVNTHIPSITVYVAKKLPMTTLQNSEKIPASLEDIPVDVVELAPTTWTAAKTSVSEMHPADQKQLLGAHRNPKANILTIKGPSIAIGGLNVDWKTWCSPVRNQGNCGSCIVAIKSGEVEYIGTHGADVEVGSCLACICRPKTALVIDA